MEMASVNPSEDWKPRKRNSAHSTPPAKVPRDPNFPTRYAALAKPQKELVEYIAARTKVGSKIHWRYEEKLNVLKLNPTVVYEYQQHYPPAPEDYASKEVRSPFSSDYDPSKFATRSQSRQDTIFAELATRNTVRLQRHTSHKPGDEEWDPNEDGAPDRVSKKRSEPTHTTSEVDKQQDEEHVTPAKRQKQSEPVSQPESVSSPAAPLVPNVPVVVASESTKVEEEDDQPVKAVAKIPKPPKPFVAQPSLHETDENEITEVTHTFMLGKVAREQIMLRLYFLGFSPIATASIPKQRNSTLIENDLTCIEEFDPLLDECETQLGRISEKLTLLDPVRAATQNVHAPVTSISSEVWRKWRQSGNADHKSDIDPTAIMTVIAFWISLIDESCTTVYDNKLRVLTSKEYRCYNLSVWCRNMCGSLVMPPVTGKVAKFWNWPAWAGEPTHIGEVKISAIGARMDARRIFNRRKILARVVEYFPANHSMGKYAREVYQQLDRLWLHLEAIALVAEFVFEVVAHGQILPAELEIPPEQRDSTISKYREEDVGPIYSYAAEDWNRVTELVPSVYHHWLTKDKFIEIYDKSVRRLELDQSLTFYAQWPRSELNKKRDARNKRLLLPREPRMIPSRYDKEASGTQSSTTATDPDTNTTTTEETGPDGEVRRSTTTRVPYSATATPEPTPKHKKTVRERMFGLTDDDIHKSSDSGEKTKRKYKRSETPKVPGSGRSKAAKSARAAKYAKNGSVSPSGLPSLFASPTGSFEDGMDRSTPFAESPTQPRDAPGNGAAIPQFPNVERSSQITDRQRDLLANVSSPIDPSSRKHANGKQNGIPPPSSLATADIPTLNSATSSATLAKTGSGEIPAHQRVLFTPYGTPDRYSRDFILALYGGTKTL